MMVNLPGVQAATMPWAHLRLAALSAGRRPRPAACQQRKRAAATALRSNLLRSCIRQRGSHRRQFPALRAALSLHQHSAGGDRARREHAAGHVRHGRRARISWQDHELSGDAQSLAAQSRVRHHRAALASAGFIDSDMAYTSGILHDVGRMALAVIQPKAYADAA